jgi:hypothetical protein
MKQAFANLVQRAGHARARPPPGQGHGQGEKESPRSAAWGLNRFIVTGKDTPDSGLVFERRGLGWKLAGIDLPPLAPGEAPRQGAAPK